MNRNQSLLASLGTWIPVTLLILALGNHCFQISRHELSPWKGGGFGMFSTLDYAPTRSIRLFLVMNGGEAVRVNLPVDFAAEFSRIKFLPGDREAQGIANRLARLKWVRVKEEPGDAALSSTQAAACSQIRPATGDQALVPGIQRLEVTKVRIEVYRSVFESSSLKLGKKLITSIESKQVR